jgi:hypothetical protein
MGEGGIEMIAALIEMSGWAGTYKKLFEGETVYDIVEQILHENDLECISEMGRSMGTKEDLKEIDKIDEFLRAFYDGELDEEKLKNFSFELSVGSHRCLGLATDEKGIAQLKTQLHDK